MTGKVEQYNWARSDVIFLVGFLTGSVSTAIPIIFNKMPPPTLIQVPAFEPSAPYIEPVLSYKFQPNGVTPLPPMDPALFEQQYGVNYSSLNQTPGSTPQNDWWVHPKK